MVFDRYAVSTAILARLQGTLNATSTPALPQPVSRRARDLSQMGPDEQPAVYLVDDSEMLSQDKGQTPRRSLRKYVLIYVRTDDTAVAPMDLLYPLINLVEKALAWTPADSPVLPGGTTTLGGLVQHVNITNIAFNDGLPSGEGSALIALDVLAFGNVAGAGA